MSTDAVAQQRPEAPVPEVLSEFAIDYETHENAPAVVVRADEVADALETARSLSYDHCACVTAQAYEDRYETVYHLRSYDDPTEELSVVVPTASDAPVSESGASVYPTADWHEREAY
ncbi:MAG: NADH-quinone oxidoreductase subunit C, partial [Natronomonas sp.]